MPDDKSIVSFLPLHYDGRPIAMALDAQGREVWIAQDICEALGLHNVSWALKSLDLDEKGIILRDTPGGPQQVSTVNESGLWHLVFKSRKEAAKAFRRWLTHDVLPTLRRYGTYTMGPPLQNPTSQALEAPLTLTPQGQLPPQKPPVREHAEVSAQMASVWRLLRQSDEWLSNREIAVRTGVAERTARAYTLYFRQLGLIDVQEYFPHHLHRIAEQAVRRNPGVYNRLEQITALIAARRQP